MALSKDQRDVLTEVLQWAEGVLDNRAGKNMVFIYGDPAPPEWLVDMVEGSVAPLNTASWRDQEQARRYNEGQESRRRSAVELINALHEALR